MTSLRTLTSPVVTGSLANGQLWAKEYGVPEQSIYNYETMPRIADNKDIDIVYVITPNALHAEGVIVAARAGKHVMKGKQKQKVRSNNKKLDVEYKMIAYNTRTMRSQDLNVKKRE